MAKPGRRRTIAQIEKDAQTLAYHLQGKTPREIMTLQGYKSQSTVTFAMKRAIADRQKDAFGSTEDFALAVARIQRAIAYHEKVMETPHFVVSTTGNVAINPATGEMILDPGPGQRSAVELRHLYAELNKLQGNYAPSKSRVEVVTDDVVQKEIDQLAKEIAEAGKGTAVPTE